MVTITNFFEKINKQGKPFISLELTSGVELLQSQNSGRFYATVRKCRIFSTFDAAIAKQIVGSKIEGEILRVPCDPYEFTNPSTGEILTLSHSYAYRPKGSMELLGASKVSDMRMA